jgi:glutamate decarboxylase
MVCGSVQICWKKFARYWDIEMRELEMLTGELCISPERVIEAVDETRFLLYPRLG